MKPAEQARKEMARQWMDKAALDLGLAADLLREHSR